MHAITFTMKRGHWSGVAFGKKVVARIADMTPARFDLMYAIRTLYTDKWKTHVYGYEMTQKALRKTLGLHPSTVSKLIKRLTQLGWLINDQPAPEDSRTRIVRLTTLGVRRIEKAMRVVFQQRTHMNHVENLFKRRLSKKPVLERIDAFWSQAVQVAQHFGDRSTLTYDFGYEPEKYIGGPLVFPRFVFHERRAPVSCANCGVTTAQTSR